MQFLKMNCALILIIRNNNGIVFYYRWNDVICFKELIHDKCIQIAIELLQLNCALMFIISNHDKINILVF